MMIQQRNIQCFRYRIQFEPIQSRQKHPGKTYRIHIGKILFDSKAFAVFNDKAHVKSGIVRHHDRTFGKFQKFWQNFFNGLCIHNHAVVDAGQLFDFKGNRHLGIDKDGKTIHDGTLFHSNRTNLDDPVSHRAETGGLDIKHYIGIIQTLPPASGNHTFHIIHQIGFHTINDLKRRIYLLHLILCRFRVVFLVLFSVIADDIVIGMICFRKRLYHSMICDCDRRMSPFVGAFYQNTGIRNPIHITHLCMAVQLHSFFRTVIHPAGGKITDFFYTRQGTDGDLMVKLVDRSHTFQLQEGTFFDRSADLRHLFVVQEHFDRDRIGKVCDIKHVDRLFVSDLSGFHRSYLSADRDLSHLSGDRINGDGIVIEISSIDHIRVVGAFQRTWTIAITTFLEIATATIFSTVSIPETAFVPLFSFFLCSCRLFSTVCVLVLLIFPLWLLFFPVCPDYPVLRKRCFHALTGQIFPCFPVTVFIPDFGMQQNLSGFLQNSQLAVLSAFTFHWFPIDRMYFQVKTAPLAEDFFQHPHQFMFPVSRNHRIGHHQFHRLRITESNL